MKIIDMTLDDISGITSEILSKAKDIHSSTATVITLEGDLGAGKTTLSQALARALGANGKIISPTFVVMKKYELKKSTYPWKYLIHIDAYRLTKSQELRNLGWQEIVDNRDNIILIEWAENVRACIPSNAYSIKLFHKDEHTREIKY